MNSRRVLWKEGKNAVKQYFSQNWLQAAAKKCIQFLLHPFSLLFQTNFMLLSAQPASQQRKASPRDVLDICERISFSLEIFPASKGSLGEVEEIFWNWRREAGFQRWSCWQTWAHGQECEGGQTPGLGRGWGLQGPSPGRVEEEGQGGELAAGRGLLCCWLDLRGSCRGRWGRGNCAEIGTISVPSWGTLAESLPNGVEGTQEEDGELGMVVALGPWRGYLVSLLQISADVWRSQGEVTERKVGGCTG